MPNSKKKQAADKKSAIEYTDAIVLFTKKIGDIVAEAERKGFRLSANISYGKVMNVGVCSSSRSGATAAND